MQAAGAFLRTFPREAVIWALGLILLAFGDPLNHHFTLCPVASLGFDFCPGCGLGRSVSWFFRGEIAASFHAHPFGIFAVFVLSFRIFKLTKQHLSAHGKNY